ncbi:hypothetical protein D8M09_02785 [Enterobacter sp. R1(2018)]|nr:hypothetical protein D8M09_02785 [Enterobacter sp. R1(2018)]
MKNPRRAPQVSPAVLFDFHFTLRLFLRHDQPLSLRQESAAGTYGTCIAAADAFPFTVFVNLNIFTDAGSLHPPVNNAAGP